MNFGKNKIL